MKKIQQIMHEVDPYKNFDAASYPQDMQGWGSDHQFFRVILEALRPTTVLEVGTWKGGSAIHMGKILRELKLDAEIVCIDTWLGSAEHILDKSNIGDSMNYVNGYPRLYYTFLSNVVASDLQDMITPFPIASESAAVVLSRNGVRADLIYIDAAHEFEPAYRDIKAFWPLLNEDGLMLCDDYGYSEVTEAVCTFAAETKRAVYATNGKAIICKRLNRPLHLSLWKIEP